MNTVRIISFVTVALLFIGVASPGRAQVAATLIDDFEDATTQDWVEGGASPNPPMNVANNGPQGVDDRYLSNEAAGGAGSGSNLVQFNTNQWAGDYTAAGITEIHFWARVVSGSDLSLRIGFRHNSDFKAGWVSTTPRVLSAADGWQRLVFTIAASEFTNSLSGQTFQQTMANVAEFRIFHSTTAVWSGPTPVAATLGVDDIEAVGQPFRGWLWEPGVAGAPLLSALAEEKCIGPMGINIADDDTWTLYGFDEVCWGRTTTNTNPARAYFNFNGVTFPDVTSFDSRSTRPLVSAGGNLLEIYGEDVEFGVGLGEERFGTVLAEPAGSNLLIVGGFADLPGAFASETYGFIDLFVKHTQAAAEARTPADLEGLWRLDVHHPLQSRTDVNLEVVVSAIRSIDLQTGGVCVYENSPIFPEFDSNGDAYMLAQLDADGVNLTNRGVQAAIRDATVSNCTWSVDTGGDLVIDATLTLNSGPVPISIRRAVSDDNNYNVSAPDPGGVEFHNERLSLGYRAPSALQSDALDGEFFIYLNFNEYGSTGTAHSSGDTGTQEVDGWGRGRIAFDSTTPGTVPPGESGDWDACDIDLAINNIEYQADGEPASGTVTTQFATEIEWARIIGCDYSLAADGSLRLAISLPDQGNPPVVIFFNGYVNHNAEVFTAYNFESSPISPGGFEDDGAIRHLLAMRYTGSPDGNEDGDEFTNFEEFALPLPPPPNLGCSAGAPPVVCSVGDVNENGFPDIAVAIPGSVVVQVRDGLDGALVSTVNFGTDPGHAVEIIDDFDGNGVAEIAVLGTRPSGQVRVQLRDALTGDTVVNLFYGNTYAGIDMAVLPDSDGNGADELAVLGREAGGGVRVQARDPLTELATSTTFWGDNADPVDVQVLPDINNSGNPEIAVHARVTASDQGRVQIRDSVSDTLIRQMFFGTAFVPLQLAVVGDMDLDALPDLAQLGRRDDTGAVRVQVRSSGNGAALSTAFLGNSELPRGVVGISDVNGDTIPDVAVLVRRTNGTGKVVVRSGLTGDFVANLFFGMVDEPVGIVLGEDFDDSGEPDLAVLGDIAGVPAVQIRNSISGDPVSVIEFP